MSSDSKRAVACTICGKKMHLYSEANYDMSTLSSFGFASRKIPEYMHWELFECESCHFLKSMNKINDDELSKKYEEADFDSSMEADNASKTYIKYLKRHYPNFPKGRAMDIGTGEGSYLKYLHLEGVESIVGVEPSVAPVQKADSLIRNCIINDVFDGNKFELETFDMISCFQTIEHVPDSQLLVKDIYSLLKNEGIIYIVCHDYKAWINRILGMKSPIYDIEHLQLFSKRSITRLLQENGYKNIESFTIKNSYPLKYWIRLFPLPDKMKIAVLKYIENSKIGNLEVGINVGNVGVIAKK